MLSDHQVKVLTGCIYNDIGIKYERYIPEEQFGACRGRGTDFASRLSHTFLSLCKMFNMSAAILFVDLSKAFDLALRQVISGFC